MQIKASSWRSERKNNVQTVRNASGIEQEKNSHYEEIFASVRVCGILDLVRLLAVYIKYKVFLSALAQYTMDMGGGSANSCRLNIDNIILLYLINWNQCQCDWINQIYNASNL